MKRRTKDILSGVLVLSILFGTPACTEAVEVRQKPAENGSEIYSEDMSGDMSRDGSEILSEEASESISEIYSEDLSEKASEDRSETDSELIPQETAETDRSVDDNAAGRDQSAEHSVLEVSLRIPDDGELDYRTYMDREADLQITVRESMEGQSIENPAGAEYQFDIDNTGIVDFGEVSGTARYDNSSGVLMTQERRIPLRINGVGETRYTITVSGISGYDAVSHVKNIKVKNSPLYDSDFYIELTRDGQVQRYEYAEWMDYLESTNGWVNDEIEVKLSDTGKKYFSLIRMEVQETAGDQECAGNPAKKRYVFWAENPDRNASTKDVENGTRSYTVGIDTEAPVLEDFCVESKCYEPTKTDTEQYYAEDFILKGTFCDAVSGVSRVEYTTDWDMEKDIEWKEAEIPQRSGMQDHFNNMNRTDFCITLSDGCYPAIAVRAYDEAGNVSEIKRYVNDAEEPVRVVVDRTAPVLSIHMTADGLTYSGVGDNWTNRDVRMEVTLDKDSCTYSGIYQYEYVYMKIGENLTDVSEKWTELAVGDKSSAELDVTKDRNGYYLFRAVSNSGVKTEEDVKQRILIQHHAAEIKPLIIGGADETKCKDGWYNKQSGTPVIRFEYPEYDNGSTSKEYDAPITIHYKLIKKSSESKMADEANETKIEECVEKSAVIGVMSCEDVTVQTDSSRQFALTKDDLSQHIVNFGYDQENREVQDGYYTLEYWITDKAGNESKKQTRNYKIDCHEPTDLTMVLDGSEFAVGENTAITYERFYRDAVSGSADAQYGISGKGSIKIRKVKKIGEWNGIDSDSLGDADNVSLVPNIRCFLYIRAEDAAGNTAEGWTNGIVVDNLAPNETAGGNGRELIIEPKGANAHGFFNDDIAIDIRVKDAPEDDNCAALKSVSSSVGRDGADTAASRELFSFTKEAPTEDELIAASGFQCTQIIDAKANESNEAYIEVTAIDRSDNIKTSTQLLKIDVTKPEIDISFDNNDAQNGRFYRKGRTATIHVHELNFDPAAVSIAVTKNGQLSDVSLPEWRSDGSNHYATFTFMEDGEYSVKASCTDLADNVSDEVESETFVIDRTAPEMTISLIAKGDELTAGRDYFNTGVTAVITVTEHNFRAEDFAINMTPVSEKGVWTHDGDMHTLRIPFDSDNGYHIDCAYTDMAGNSANTVERDFVIDTIAPVITVEGVTDGSANSGAILPVISVLDGNIEESGISVSVVTGIGDVMGIAIETEQIDGGSGTGWLLTLSDLTEKPDNIYHLTVSAHDRAGNEAEISYRFSLNRNGSVYDLTSLVHLMENHYNTYSGLNDIRIVEMNIDTVEEFELYVSRNGMIGYKAEYTKEVSGSAEAGYTYSYSVKKENFAEEGTYRLSLYSRDRAGNEVNNAADIHGNEISFVIDNTAPRVVIDGVRSGMMYDVDAQEVHVSVTDNFKLAEAELTLVNKSNEVLERWDYMELAGEGEELIITISQHNEEVSLLYRVRDAAGNEMQTFQGDRAALDDFLVTTDRFVQFVNKPSKTPLGRLIILVTGVSGLIALSAVAISIRKRKQKYL